MAEKIVLSVVGNLQVTAREYGVVSNDDRFVLASLPATWPDFIAKVKEPTQPDIYIIYAEVSPGPDELAQVLNQFPSLAVLLIPASWQQLKGKFETIDRVRSVFVLPAASAEVLRSAESIVKTQRAAQGGGFGLAQSGVLGGAGAANTTVVGTRVIALVSANGGTGKSTLAEALAYELAQRRAIKTLLCSFDLPASSIPHLGAHLSPHLGEYLARPETGITHAIQVLSKDRLHMVVAPQDSFAYAQAAQENAALLRQVAAAAYTHQYGAILLDLPSGESSWTIQPLLSANLVLLVAEPTLRGIQGVGHILRLLTEQLQGQHQIPKESIFIVLNRRTGQSTQDAIGFVSQVQQFVGWAPPVLSVVKEDTAITRAQDLQRPAIEMSKELSSAMVTLVDALFGGSVGQGGQPVFRKERSLFGVRVKVK